MRKPSTPGQGRGGGSSQGVPSADGTEDSTPPRRRDKRNRADTIRALRRWALDLRVDVYSKAVLHCLIQYHGDAGRWSFPSMERIARESGVSERKARKVIRSLEERGLLSVNRSNGRRVNRYHLTGNPAPRAGFNGAQPGTGGGVNPAHGTGFKNPQPGTTGSSTRHTVPPTGKTGTEACQAGIDHHADREVVS